MISQSTLRKVILVGMGILLAGCQGAATPAMVGEIQVQPSTTILTGETASLTISVSGTGLKFHWTALKGSLSDPSQPSVIYTAPASPGPDTVTVEITNKAGSSLIKSINFQVFAPTPTPGPTASNTPVPTDTPPPTPTLTPTPVPQPILCNLPPVTKNLFPQLAEETGQFPIYGPVNETRFLCEGVYDRVHSQLLAIHLKYESVGANPGWWGIATPRGYNASQYSQICFWAYAQQPNQSFRLKMKDMTMKEQGVIVMIEATNQWEQICTDMSEFSYLGTQVDRMNNINLGFDQTTGSAEVWVADFEFKK